MWQDLAALTLVLISTLYLAYRLRRRWRKPGGCGSGCNACPQAPTSRSKPPIVSLSDVTVAPAVRAEQPPVEPRG